MGDDYVCGELKMCVPPVLANLIRTVAGGRFLTLHLGPRTHNERVVQTHVGVDKSVGVLCGQFARTPSDTHFRWL